MTLSHAIEKTPSIIGDALNDLNSIIKTNIQSGQTVAKFEQVEKEIQAALVAAERLVLGEILSQYNIDALFVVFDKKISTSTSLRKNLYQHRWQDKSRALYAE